MLTDPSGPHIHVESIDKLDELAFTLEQYAYQNQDDSTIPRFIHITCLANDSE
jgi:hypothetical protein